MKYKNIVTNTKNTRLLIVKLFSATIVVFTAFFISCSSIGGFNRSAAASLIEKDNRFRSPASITIDIGARLTNAGAGTPQISADDPQEAAIERAKEDFMQRQPQIIVAEHLGYIKLYFENGQLRNPEMGEKNYRTDLKIWSFRARAEITDAGRKLWSDLNLNVDEMNLPLAVRGKIDVTGLKDENPRIQSADFTYQWLPTDLGKAFDPDSGEFKKLPENLQEALKKTQRNIFGTGSSNIVDFSSKRAGRAFFQKYDSGYRIGEMFFF